MIELISHVKAVLRKHNCNKPVWNTESGWAEPKHFSSEEEAAGYMLRTYILNWLLGVQRCYWYAWDNHNWSTLDLTSRDESRMTRVGAAYDVLHGWLLGAVLQSCERQRTGVWTCELQRGTSITRLLWSDEGTYNFALPASWHAKVITDWTGQTSAATPQITVTDAPVLVSGN